MEPGWKACIQATRLTPPSHNVQMQQMMKESVELAKECLVLLKEKEKAQAKFRADILNELRKCSGLMESYHDRKEKNVQKEEKRKLQVNRK